MTAMDFPWHLVALAGCVLLVAGLVAAAVFGAIKLARRT